MQAVFLFATAVVPVIDKACSLDRLGYDIGCMTCEQQVVPRLHPPGKPREDHRVEGKSGSHGAGYDLLILAQISDGSQGETEVGNLEEGVVEHDQRRGTEGLTGPQK